MKRWTVLLLTVIVTVTAAVLAGSCRDDPPPRQTAAPSRPAAQPGAGTPAASTASSKPAGTAPAFDPSSISQEQKDTAKLEIQQLIQKLNGIIREKNYNGWVSYLDTGFFATINSKEYLDRVSQSPVLVKQKIVLKSARDYFNHVVVPARTNDRVDDIEFISRNRVKAYTVNAAGNRLRLYDLEKTENGWKIIN